jgi:hypothetical protein
MESWNHEVGTITSRSSTRAFTYSIYESASSGFWSSSVPVRIPLEVFTATSFLPILNMGPILNTLATAMLVTMVSADCNPAQYETNQDCIDFCQKSFIYTRPSCSTHGDCVSCALKAIIHAVLIGRCSTTMGDATTIPRLPCTRAQTVRRILIRHA